MNEEEKKDTYTGETTEESDEEPDGSEIVSEEESESGRSGESSEAGAGSAAEEIRSLLLPGSGERYQRARHGCLSISLILR